MSCEDENTQIIENYQNTFEIMSKRNGFTYWFARDLSITLGYKDYSTFKKSINRAIGLCTGLNIAYEDNFERIDRIVDGSKISVEDYKLSRFACYLIVMSCDNKKKEVAIAQAYLAKYAETLVDLEKEAENLDRLELREELTTEEKCLAGVVKEHGIQKDKYSIFQDAGYRGLYNMSLRDLKRVKGIPQKNTLLDFMGSTELGANIFRMTQTKEKIKSENIQGQNALEKAHERVGREVRESMKRMHNKLPESLPIEKDIKKVKTDIKKTHKKMKNINKEKD